MALSNSFDFTLQRDALIKRVLLMLGVISATQTPTTEEVASASNALNLMLKAWQADGLQLWQTQTLTVTPTTSTDYIFGDGTITTYQPIDVLEVYRRTVSTDIWIELIRVSRNDFNTLSDHDTTGVPVNFYYNNDKDNGILSVWPIADTNFIANNTLQVVLTKPFDDMDTATDNLAFPQYWELAVVYGLCVLLGPEYGLPTQELNSFIRQAELTKKAAMDWDMEHASMFFQPEFIRNG